jgi:hypothetical protein
LEAERTAVLEHGDAMASILGMPSVEDDEASGGEWTTSESSKQETVPEAKRETSADFPAEEANSDAQKRLAGATLLDLESRK